MRLPVFLAHAALGLGLGVPTAASATSLVRRGADGKRETYRDSGPFVRRDGRWQAVTWQATMEPAEAAK